MHRIDGADHVANQFVEGNPQLGQAATKITADWLNDTVQEELLNVIEDVGIVPNKADNTQLLQAIGLHVSGEGPRFRNALINGDFKVWQRYSPSSLANVGNTQPAGYRAYVPDRWLCSAGDDSAGVLLLVSRQDFAADQDDVPGKPPHYAVLEVPTGADSTTLRPFIEQRIEGVGTFEGRSATVSCYMRLESGSEDVTARLVQHFGTGGTPNADVETVATDDFTLTTSWQRFVFTFDVPTIDGLGVGTNGDDYLAVRLELPLGWVDTELHLADVQFEARSFASPFFRRTHAAEEADCYRYFESSHMELYLEAPAIPFTPDLDGATACTADPANNECVDLETRFRVRKRVQPAMEWFSPGPTGSGNDSFILWGGADRAVSSTLFTSQHSTGWPDCTSAPASVAQAFAHWVADAEL